MFNNVAMGTGWGYFRCENNTLTLDPGDQAITENEADEPVLNPSAALILGPSFANASIQDLEASLAALSQIGQALAFPEQDTTTENTIIDIFAPRANASNEIEASEAITPATLDGAPNPAYLIARFCNRVKEFRTYAKPVPRSPNIPEDFDLPDELTRSRHLIDAFGTGAELSEDDPLRKPPYNLKDGKITQEIYDLMNNAGFKNWHTLPETNRTRSLDFIQRLDECFKDAHFVPRINLRKDQPPSRLERANIKGANLLGFPLGSGLIDFAELDGALIAQDKAEPEYPATQCVGSLKRAIILENKSPIQLLTHDNSPAHINGLIYYLNNEDPDDPLNTKFRFDTVDATFTPAFLEESGTPGEDDHHITYNLATIPDGTIPIQDYSFEETAVLDFMGAYPQFISKFDFSGLGEDIVPPLTIRGELTRKEIGFLATNRGRFSEIQVSDEAVTGLTNIEAIYLSSIVRVGGHDTRNTILKRAFDNNQE